MSRTTDMTQGRPFGLLIGFAVPIFLSDLCLQLYTMVDSLVVGRLIGVDAFAAVGASGFFSWLFISALLGFLQGFGVVFGQRFGGKDLSGLRRAAASAILLSIGLGALLTICGLATVKPVLLFIDTPADILPDTLLYLRWILGGLFVTLANRLAGSLLMALGNSRACLTGTILSSASNGALDLLFVGAFRWGVSGAAAATIAAQLLCFFYCFWKLWGVPEVRLSRRDFRWDAATAKELLRLGGPMGFRDAVISLGGLSVQSAVNAYGKLFVAGIAASKKYFGFMQLIAGGLEGAFATFSAQNFGSRDMGRIRVGQRTVVKLGLISSIAIAALAALFGKPLIGLLVSGKAEELAQVARYGYKSFLAIAAGLPALYLLFLYRAGLQGMGNSLFPMLSGFLELACRIGAVTLLPPFLGEWAVYLADPLGWLMAFLLLFTAYRHVFRKNLSLLKPNGKSPA